MIRGGKGSADGKEESEGVLVRRAAAKAHLGVEGQAPVVRAMGRVRLNELVVVKDGWVRNKVEQVVGVWDVWDFEEFRDEEFCEVYAVSERAGMDLLQLVHNNFALLLVVSFRNSRNHARLHKH